jgi:SAM-dependent methyltransferase
MRHRTIDGPRLEGWPWPADLDAPSIGEPAFSHSVRIRGWVALPKNCVMDGVALVVDKQHINLGFMDRSDVERGFPSRQVVGFTGFIPVTNDRVNTDWKIELVVDGQKFITPARVSPSLQALDDFRTARSLRLERIEPILRCPALSTSENLSLACGGLLVRRETELVCQKCGNSWPATDGFDFLSNELRKLAATTETEAVSSWGYDPFAEEIIARADGELVLDAGAGCKPGDRLEVVNLEVARYPSTDVLAPSESLPFANDSFAAALSLTVLEHVRDPARCVGELARVVRPGGSLYVVVPFLQPYHGYPGHYFNMSHDGLATLLEPYFDIEQAGTPPFGWPIWTLTWFLNRYLVGLPETDRVKFRSLTVDQLLAVGFDYLGEDFVQNLSESSRTELASVNYAIAVRK